MGPDPFLGQTDLNLSPNCLSDSDSGSVWPGFRIGLTPKWVWPPWILFRVKSDPGVFRVYIPFNLSIQSFFAERFFHLIDTDHSGSINLKELIAALRVLIQGTATDKLRFLFRVYDVDGMSKQRNYCVLSRFDLVCLLEVDPKWLTRKTKEGHYTNIL